MRSRLLLPLLCLLMLSACKPSVNAPSAPPATGSGAAAKLSYPQVLTMALNGNHDAEFELGAMFHDGDGIAQDYAKAIEWYTLAANAGNRQAQFNLGMMMKNGEGVPANATSARDWFVRASDAGDVRATLQLGIMAYAAEDFDKALPFFLKAANGGSAEAQMNVGVMHIRGEGVPAQDILEGYAWLTLAKAGGNARAAGMLESLSKKMTEEQKNEGDSRALVLKAQVKEEAGPNAKVQ